MTEEKRLVYHAVQQTDPAPALYQLDQQAVPALICATHIHHDPTYDLRPHDQRLR